MPGAIQGKPPPEPTKKKEMAAGWSSPFAISEASRSESLPSAIASGSPNVEVSIVIPLLNEAANLESLYDQLRLLLKKLERKCEVILVDDGSNDGSFEILRDLHAQDDRIRVVYLRRNFGQTAAFSAGFDISQGEIIVTMDGDLQNDPADIPLLLDKIDEGNDIVSGWRINRKDKFLTRRLPSQVANWLIIEGIPARRH
jgi:glycosyltransferase involved in cell wall biosynthesis